MIILNNNYPKLHNFLFKHITYLYQIIFCIFALPYGIWWNIIIVHEAFYFFVHFLISITKTAKIILIKKIEHFFNEHKKLPKIGGSEKIKLFLFTPRLFFRSVPNLVPFKTSRECVCVMIIYKYIKLSRPEKIYLYIWFNFNI